MIWNTPSERDADSPALENRLWDSAGQFHANSGLKAQEYSSPILGTSRLLHLQIQTLRRTLNLLPPRLLSGQISV